MPWRKCNSLKRVKTTWIHHKSYADGRRRELEFYVEDWVFQKVLPMNGVIRFGNKRKLNPRYVYPYKILKMVGKMAYELKLSTKLATIHPNLHIQLLKKCVGDPTSILHL